MAVCEAIASKTCVLHRAPALWKNVVETGVRMSEFQSPWREMRGLNLSWGSQVSNTVKALLESIKIAPNINDKTLL